jgi:predicted nuclease of predicted toxin-antitoxin system
MRFYTDEDVPVHLAPLGQTQGLDILTAREAGMRGRSDREQLLFAGEQGRCLITNNPRDFSELCIAFEADHLPHAGVLGLKPQVGVRHVGRVAVALKRFADEHSEGMTPYLMLYLRW